MTKEEEIKEIASILCVAEEDGFYLPCEECSEYYEENGGFKCKNYIKAQEAYKYGIRLLSPDKQKCEKDQTADDPVNAPAHYTFGKFETIDIIRDKLTPEQVEGFCVGNAIKYITRYQHKNGVEDLEKAIWYLNLIVAIKKGNENRT